MSREAVISYWLIALLLGFVGWLHLGVPFLAVLFSYFALEKLNIGGRRQAAVILFSALVLVAGLAFFYFAKQAIVALPRITQTAIPVFLEFAEKQGVELPFSDYASMKVVALETAKSKFAGLGKSAQVAVIEVVSLIIGVVVAVSLFSHPAFELDAPAPGKRRTMYSGIGKELGERFKMFYSSFRTVMGAQIAISAINTSLTSIFLLWNGFPYVSVIIGLTFLFGLLPIIGNLLSNTLIVGVAFTISPRLALTSLIFLVVLHKLEYFLNSKIIGERIRNPMWLTLLGLLLGEKLMGLPGMILAPVALHYIKMECSRPIWNAGGDSVAAEKEEGVPEDPPKT